MNIEAALSANATPLAPATHPRRQEHLTGREYELGVLHRFVSKVQQTETCWLWTSPLRPDGYAQMWVDGKNVLAHRVAWGLHIGPAPVELDHRCRVRHCVNPAHLRPVTRKQNNENVRSRGRSGVRGVSWMKSKQKWQVRVRHDGQLHYGGIFADLAEAEKVAIAMRNTLFTHNAADRKAA